MSKGLANYPEETRLRVATRRVSNNTRGCGYWGAVGYLNKKGIKTKEQRQAEAVNLIMENSIIARNNAIAREKKLGKLHKSSGHTRGIALSDRNKRTLASFRRKTA